jgi:hypothetical protein
MLFLSAHDGGGRAGAAAVFVFARPACPHQTVFYLFSLFGFFLPQPCPRNPHTLPSSNSTALFSFNEHFFRLLPGRLPPPSRRQLFYSQSVHYK